MIQYDPDALYAISRRVIGGINNSTGAVFEYLLAKKLARTLEGLTLLQAQASLRILDGEKRALLGLSPTPFDISLEGLPGNESNRERTKYTEEYKRAVLYRVKKEMIRRKESLTRITLAQRAHFYLSEIGVETIVTFIEKLKIAGEDILATDTAPKPAPEASKKTSYALEPEITFTRAVPKRQYEWPGTTVAKKPAARQQFSMFQNAEWEETRRRLREEEKNRPRNNPIDVTSTHDTFRRMR